MADADKYNFLCEHYDEMSQMTKEYMLTLFVKTPPAPNELSLYDIKAKRVFLKRGTYDQDCPIRLEDLHLNGRVTICARKFKVTAFADSATRDHFASNSEHAFVTVGPDAFHQVSMVLSAAGQAALLVKRLKTFRDMAQPGAHRPSVAMELVGTSAVEVLGEVLSRCGAGDAIRVAPMSPSAEKIFDSTETTATHDACSVCIIRPHAVREGLAGTVIEQLQAAGLEISAMQGFSLTRSQAEQFYEVYKTVLPSAQYMAMIGELASGVCIVIEVRGGEQVVRTLRELCGPYDVEIARHLRPDTIRAQLGRDNVHNVVHCTDLPEDGILESQYFFSILPAAGA